MITDSTANYFSLLSILLSKAELDVKCKIYLLSFLLLIFLHVICLCSTYGHTLLCIDRNNIVKFEKNCLSTCRDISHRRFSKIQDGRQSAILIYKVSILGHTLLCIDRNNIVKFENNRLSTCRDISHRRFSRWPPVGQIDLQSINTWSYITLYRQEQHCKI